MLSRGASVGVDKELKNILRCRMGMSLCSNSKKYDSVKSASLSSNFRGENLGSDLTMSIPVKEIGTPKHQNKMLLDSHTASK